MLDKILITLACPHCNLEANAKIKDDCFKFIVYTCPRCKSNVVYYNNRIDIISNRMFKKLFHNSKLQSCGVISFEDRDRTIRIKKKTNKLQPQPKKVITDNDIIDLKILLETSKDIEDFLKNL